MYKNRSADGSNNVSGKNIEALRKKSTPKLSQRALAESIQRLGIDMDKNAIQRIESGKRFITDIELKAFGNFFTVSADYLLTSHCE